MFSQNTGTFRMKTKGWGKEGLRQTVRLFSTLQVTLWTVLSLGHSPRHLRCVHEQNWSLLSSRGRWADLPNNLFERGIIIMKSKKNSIEIGSVKEHLRQEVGAQTGLSGLLFFLRTWN